MSERPFTCADPACACRTIAPEESDEQFVYREGRHVAGDGWPERLMRLAVEVSRWSKDPSTKVGAVIVDSQRRVVGLGYNGFPRGVRDDPARYEDRETKYKLVVHSEANAILNAGRSIAGCTLYATKSPCSECTKLLIQAGIANVVCPPPSAIGVWADDAKHAQLMLREAGVAVTIVQEPQTPELRERRRVAESLREQAATLRRRELDTQEPEFGYAASALERAATQIEKQ